MPITGAGSGIGQCPAYADEPIYFASLRPGGVETEMADKVSAVSPEICPMSATIRHAQAQQTLSKPDTAARFMEWVLFHTSTQEYEKHWDINV